MTYNPRPFTHPTSLVIKAIKRWRAKQRRARK